MRSPHGALRRAAVIANPVKFPDVDLLRHQLTQVCREHGWDDPWWALTTVEDPGGTQTERALEAGCDLVVPVGGDGTVRAVASSLIGTDVPLGLVPGGTGNLLARNLDLPVHSRREALAVAITGRDRRIDVGQVRAWEEDGTLHEEHFLVMAGVGMDAAVMEATDAEVKRRMGWLAYLGSAVRLSGDQPVVAGIRLDDEELVTRKVRSVVFGNVGRVQGGMPVLPGALVDDGRLDTAIVAPRGITGWPGVAASMLTRGSLGGQNATYHQGDRVDVRLAEPTPAQVDGDPLGRVTRMAARVLPGALTVRVRSDH